MFSPSRRRRVGEAHRYMRYNSPWDEGVGDETVNEVEQSDAFLCCGVIRAKQKPRRCSDNGAAVWTGNRRAAAFMAGLAALLWASLPLAVASSADVSLPSVG